jgi:hypothetical protein
MVNGIAMASHSIAWHRMAFVDAGLALGGIEGAGVIDRPA